MAKPKVHVIMRQFTETNTCTVYSVHSSEVKANTSLEYLLESAKVDDGYAVSTWMVLNGARVSYRIWYSGKINDPTHNDEIFWVESHTLE